MSEYPFDGVRTVIAPLYRSWAGTVAEVRGVSDLENVRVDDLFASDVTQRTLTSAEKEPISAAHRGDTENHV